MSSHSGEDGGRHEMVAGPSGMPCPHLALRTVGKRRFITTSFVPKAGRGADLLHNKIVKYCFDLSLFIIF